MASSGIWIVRAVSESIERALELLIGSEITAQVKWLAFRCQNKINFSKL